MSLSDRLAVNLRAARNAAGVSREELAERCGLHWTMVDRMEQGRLEPRLGAVLKLANALDVAPESLWSD